MYEIEELIDAIGVPILVFDRSLTLKYYNDAAKTLIPNVKKNLAAESIFNDKKISSQILRCLDMGQTEFRRIRYKIDNGTELAVNIKSLHENDSKIAIVALNDLSPLSEAKTMRSDFVANVSHEIRSPLTSISGFIETLQGPAGDDIDKRHRFLSVVAKETDRMKNLVTDLLSLSLVEAKEKRAINTSVNPELLIRMALQTTMPLAKAVKKNIKLNIDANLPDIIGNQENLHRVLINLIENAINYSSEGETIRINATLTENDNEFSAPALKISICDRGEGIHQDEIPRLTERFYRVDKSRSRNMGGTGLGLAIVKHILVRHKGVLSIDSVLGEGSSFNVFLPLN